MKPFAVEIKGCEGYQRLIGGVPESAGMKSGCVALKPGESVGEHSTDAKEEAILVMEGNAEISFAGFAPVTAARESVIYVPPNTKHNVKNIGDGQLRYVYVVAPVR